MANASLFMDIIAKDGASPVFNKIAASAGQMSKGMDKAAKSHSMFGRAVKYAFGMVSAYSIGRFVSSSIKEFAAAELAQNKLENAYRRFPKVANVNIEAFRSLNTAMMQKTRFDDDAAAAMQANLARFDLTGKEILKLTPLVMDLAEATGTDLVTAGGQLGKAFLGNTRALKQLGISYEMTGNRAKDTANIIDLVNKKVGGEATRAGKTTAVQLEILKNQYGELKETVGQALIPAFSKLVDVAGPAIADLGAAIDRNMPQIEQTFEDVWNAGSKVAGVIKDMWDAFASMPPGVRDTLLLLGGGAFALGKFKGSAIGQGVGAMFSGLKTITAGNVTVIGKTVTGTPGAGKPGALGATGTALFSGMLTPVLVGTIVSALAAAGVYQGLKNKYGVDTPEGTSKWIDATRNRNLGRGSDRGLGMGYRSERTQMRDIADAAKEATGAAGRLVTQIRMMPKPAKEAAAEANRVAAAVAKAAQGKQIKLTVKGAKQAAADAADVAAKIRRIQNKDARVTAKGARQAAADAVNFASKLRALPRAKDTKVSAPGAVAAKSQVDGLRNSIAALQSKTIDIRTRYITEGRPGKQAMQASGGYISGPGGPTDDAIPAWLSNGEYVIRAAAVRRYGVGTFHRLNAMGFAEGGFAQAKKDANWQQRLAKFISKYQLGADAADWLAGLERKPARRFMKHPKQIGKFARRAGSVGAYRSAADAQRAYDAMLGDMGFDAMDAYARKATLDQRIQATAKDAGSKNPAKRAKAYEKLQTLRQKLADTEQEIADKQAAAAEKERNAQEAVRAAIEETAQSYRSFASIATTSVDDVTAAQEKLTTAQDAVAEARKRFDLAGNDRDRAQAARELAEAEKNLTTAQQERNNVSDKVTANSIRANMGSKLTRLRDFASAVKTLKNQGLNATTLADILSMGPDQGYEYAKALLDGGLGDINALQSQITAESADLGLFTAGVNSASATTIGQINAAAGGLNVALVPAPVTLQLNGREIATALLEYQRQNGA